MNLNQKQKELLEKLRSIKSPGGISIQLHHIQSNESGLLLYRFQSISSKNLKQLIEKFKVEYTLGGELLIK